MYVSAGTVVYQTTRSHLGEENAMRFKSMAVGGFQVFAVTGTNTISFAIQATDAAKKGLLGFAVERSLNGAPRRRMPGFKVFKSIIPKPDKNTTVSTWDHPVQSFVWDDFTAQPGSTYEFFFHPLRGTPAALDRTGAPVSIKIETEALFTKDDHDIFFNRGVASSQSYARQFGNKKPSQLSQKKAERALQWLTRDLDEAILRFIQSAKKGDTLLGCFYEFRYMPVLAALQKAIDDGVKVEIIIDAKVNEFTDKKGKFHPSFPREDNLAAIKDAGIKKTHIIERDANPSDIQHNKFLILLKGKKQTPSELWTGSTNISMGGFTGQTNVGHWVKDAKVARAFKAYWDVLADDPGSTKQDDTSTARKKKKAFRTAVEALTTLPAAASSIGTGVTPVFSPRLKLAALDLYVKMADSASTAACMTLAFGISAELKQALVDNTDQNHIVFLLLEKQDTPDSRSSKPFVTINAKNNVYKAWGAFLRDPVYQWVRETNARELQFNQHVAYIHSKFLLMDPLGADPIVVTGSANFSKASTTDNDENMMIIRGNTRVADIYFTEFNRLFNHYYFRAVQESLQGQPVSDANLFLDETGKQWLKKYLPGTLRAKRVGLYASMKRTVTV
jgi:phosphatidylserine/phosphatidylglycerophosphate/cardiolipin synthase-like enzyme